MKKYSRDYRVAVRAYNSAWRFLCREMHLKHVKSIKLSKKKIEYGRDLQKIKVMDDNSKMPFGKFKNEKMANVPASYLMWLHRESKCYGDLKKYIEDNMEALQQEIESGNNRGQKGY